MCTVSIIALRHGFRLVSNRDEQHTRPESAAPAWRAIPSAAGAGAPMAEAPGLRAIWPADLRADGSEGGTWIGASERGLALTLLNYNLTPAPALPGEARSRGDLIPSLLHLNSAHAVAAALHEADLSAFAPFRLIAVERATPEEAVMVAEVRWNRVSVSSVWHRAPVCFASSGLGDHLVEVRLPLFERLVASEVDRIHEGDADSEVDPDGGVDRLAAIQDAFHAHAWPDRRHVSVMMHREAARTVSTTAVEVVRDGWTGRARVRMDYRPIPAEAAANHVGAMHE